MNEDTFIEDSRRGLETFRKEVHRIECISSSIQNLSLSFFKIGNDYIGELLEYYSDELSNSAKSLRKERHDDIDHEYKRTMKQTGNILNALLERSEKD